MMTKLIRTVYMMGMLLLIVSCVSTTTTGIAKVKLNDNYTPDVFHVSELAEDAYRESRWTDATRHYQQLTETVPGDAYIWFRLANAYVQRGDFNLAIHAYESSVERDALQPKPWFNLSTAYLLHAKAALLRSWENMRPIDPARDLIMHRVSALDSLLNQNLEEVSADR